MDKSLFFKVFCMLVLLVSVISVSALGITPAKKIIEFEEGLMFSSEFKVINTKDAPTDISFDVSGELSKYILLGGGGHLTLESNSEKIIKYTLNLPSGVSRKDISAGDNDVYFTVREVVDSKENSISTSVGLVTMLRVKVPYGLKHIKPELYIYEGDVETNTIFVIPIENLGINNLEKVRAVLSVWDDGTLVGGLESEYVSISSGVRDEIRLVWPTDVGAGEYLARVVVEYDSDDVVLEKIFFVDGMKLLITDLSVGEILGDAARFEVKAKNVWNEELTNVYAEVEVYDLNGSLFDSFTTSKMSILRGGVGTFVGYIDVDNMTYGEYTTKLIVHYGNKEIEKVVETTFVESGLTVGEITSYGGGWKWFGNGLSFFLIFGIGFLVVVNTLWLLFFKEKK